MHSPELEAEGSNPREKLPWETPEFSHFRAGEAEASDINTTDGPFIS
jgi:hypothetical protein